MTSSMWCVQHQLAVDKPAWDLGRIETAGRKQAKAEIKRLNEEHDTARRRADQPADSGQQGADKEVPRTTAR